MWWAETNRQARMKRGRGLAAAVLGLSLVGVLGAGCTVRPLYADADAMAATGGTSAGTAEALRAIAVPPVNTRQAQEVRNELIFLLGGGRGQPAEPRYTLGLTVVSFSESAAEVQVATDAEPTAATITMIANYVLTDAATGQPVAQGTRRVISSYDVPRQEFAALRAERDAEDRAAREIAEFLRLALAQDVSEIEPARAVK